MVTVQRIAKDRMPLFACINRMPRGRGENMQVGFYPGERLNVFQRGDTLLYTYKDSYKGFERSQITEREQKALIRKTNSSYYLRLPDSWVDSYTENLYVRVYYTRDGVFVRPYSDQFKDLLFNA